MPASLAGLPALSVLVAVSGEEGSWLIGVSVVGKWGCEQIVLAIGDD